MEPAQYREGRSANSHDSRTTKTNPADAEGLSDVMSVLHSSTSPNNVPAEIPVRNPLRQSSSPSNSDQARTPKPSSHHEVSGRKSKQSPSTTDAGPSKPRTRTDQPSSSSSATQSFNKPDYNGQAPTRTLSMNKEPTIVRFASPKIDNGNTAEKSSMKKSMSWAEASGQSAIHPFELNTDLRSGDQITVESARERAWQPDNANLDEWSYDGRNGFEPGDFTLPIQEGWDYVRCIPKENIVKLAMQYKPPGTTSGAVIQYDDGQNNLVAIVEFDNSTKYCVRMPACGSKGIWNNAAKATLLNAVDTMRYIKATTKLLIPDVIAYDAGFDNVIAAPFVIMSFVQGRPLHEKWWKDHTQDFVTVSPELEETRQKILKSIANQVFQLRHLKFDGYGEFRLSNGEVSEPIVVPVKMRPFLNVLENHELKKRAKRFSQFVIGGAGSSESSSSSMSGAEVSLSSYDVWVQGLHEWFSITINLAMENDVFHSPEEDPMIGRIRGIFSLHSLIIKYLPYAPGTKESYPDEEFFVMAQTDFNPQNIFLDEEGNVTSFIDWDFTDTKPRYMGWARQPVWLCEDWDREKIGNGFRTWPSVTATASCEFEKYRKDYARYLIEACGPHSDDWRFALKCHLFEAITMSIGRTKDMEQLLLRLLNTHIGPFDWDAHFIDLGRNGFQPGLQKFYENLFKRILECDPYMVKAELGMLNVTTELQAMTSTIMERDKANEDVQRTQRELVDLYRKQLTQCRNQVFVLQETLARLQRGTPSPAKQEQASSRDLPPSQHKNRTHFPKTPVTDCAPAISSRRATILETRRREYKTPPSPDISVHTWRSDEEYVMSGALRPETPPPDHKTSPARSLLFEVPRPHPRLRSPPPGKTQSRWQGVFKKARARFSKLKHAQVNTISGTASYPEHLADVDQAIVPTTGTGTERARTTDADRSRRLVTDVAEKVKRACKNAYRRWNEHNEGTTYAWDLYTYGAYDPDQRSDSVQSDDLYTN